MAYQVIVADTREQEAWHAGFYENFLEAKRHLKSIRKEKGWGRVLFIDNNGEAKIVFSITSDGQEHWFKFNYLLER